MAFQPPPKSSIGSVNPTSNVTPLWLAQCQTTKSGVPLNNLHNVLLALRGDPHWQDKFRFDEMKCCAVLPDGRAREDSDDEDVHEWMQANGLPRVGLDVVREAVNIVARDQRFHPVRDWLDGLVWDQQNRLSDWLSTYLGTAQDNYHSSIGCMFMIAMVARIYQPGCKCDYMIVLEGPQGIMKSQVCKVLGGEHYSDALPDLTADAVRLSMHLAGKWLIEVPELSSFHPAEASHLKSFLSRDVEIYTRKFGRRDVHEPRQCVLIGTTNKDTYLRDETGGRRFWPAKCGTIDIDGLRDVRDQLFAEAVVLFRQGTQWWPDTKVQDTLITPMQESRYQDDPWESAIERWDRKIPECDGNGKPIYRNDAFGNPTQAQRIDVTAPYSLLDIARGALHLPTDRLSKREAMRLATMLESMRWTRAPRTRTVRSAWHPPVTPSVTP